MSTDEYVPSEDDMRETWVDHESKCMWGPHPGDPSAEFDRFLAGVRRDAAREALDGLADHIDLVASQFLGVHVGTQKAQDVRDYRDTHYPERTDR